MKYGIILSADGIIETSSRPKVKAHGAITGCLSSGRSAALCSVTVDFDGDRTRPIRALIGTGSSITVIDRSVMDSIAVRPLSGDFGTLLSVNGKTENVPIYRVSLYIGEAVIENVEAWEGDTSVKGAHMIIGTDVLRLGRMSYDGMSGTFSLEI